MRRILWIAILVMSMSGTTSAYAQSDDCWDYCDPEDASCELEWADVHSEMHDEQCTNYGSNHNGLDGYCAMEFAMFNGLKQAQVEVDCNNGACNITGKLRCGGVLRDYSLRCTGANASDTPQGDGGRSGASCVSNGFGVTVTCNGTTGQLIFSSFTP